MSYPESASPIHAGVETHSENLSKPRGEEDQIVSDISEPYGAETEARPPTPTFALCPCSQIPMVKRPKNISVPGRPNGGNLRTILLSAGWSPEEFKRFKVL